MRANICATSVGTCARVRRLTAIIVAKASGTPTIAGLADQHSGPASKCVVADPAGDGDGAKTSPTPWDSSRSSVAIIANGIGISPPTTAATRKSRIRPGSTSVASAPAKLTAGPTKSPGINWRCGETAASSGTRGRRNARARSLSDAATGDKPEQWRCVMAWLILVASGVLEAVWATALGRSEGFTRLVPSVVFGITCAASMIGLAIAMRSLPIGTSYAVWVGIGASLTVGYAMLTGAESTSLVKILLILGLIGCIIGLKILSH